MNRIDISRRLRAAACLAAAAALVGTPLLAGAKPAPKTLPNLSSGQFERLLKDTLRRENNVGAYFIRIDEQDGAIIYRQTSVIQSACGTNVPNTLVMTELPTQERLDRVKLLMDHVNRTLAAHQPLIIRTEPIASVCHSAVPTDQ